MVTIKFVASAEQMVGVARIVSKTPVDIGNTGEESDYCLFRLVPNRAYCTHGYSPLSAPVDATDW
jgi:hypothetical protein